MRTPQKRKRRFHAITALIGVLVLLMTACTGASPYNTSTSYDEASPEAGSEDAAGAAYDFKNASKAEEGNTDVHGNEGAAESGSAQKLIYTSHMEIQTLDFPALLQDIRKLIRDHDGILESESITDSDYDWYKSSGMKREGTFTSSMVIRVPAEKYEGFLESLEGAGGKITSRSTNVENITRAYNDQTIYIASLEKQEERLLQMMEQAASIEDMITIEQRLTEVQTELNQARSNLANMDTDVAYSTVYLSLTEVVRYSDPVRKTTFFERTRSTSSKSIHGFLIAMELLLDVFIYIFPYLLIPGFIAAVTLFVQSRKRRAQRPPKKQGEEQMSVKFDDFLQKQLQDPEFKKEYEALQPEHAIIQSIIDARQQSGLTQKEGPEQKA